MPEIRSFKYHPTTFCRLRANRRIEHLVEHVRKKPCRDSRFIDTTSFESLSLIQEQISRKDLVFLEVVEEQSDEILWNTKDWIQDMPKQQAYFLAHRIFVLQLRYTILNARILLFELEAVAIEKLIKAKADWQAQRANRRLALMQRVKRHEVDVDQELNWAICYRGLHGWWLPGFLCIIIQSVSLANIFSPRSVLPTGYVWNLKVELTSEILVQFVD